MSKNGKMEIQNIVEKILQKHGIDTTKDFYIKLSQAPYQDLVLERNGSIILVGHYREENGDLISDPVLAMSESQGFWSPLRIELWCGDTLCQVWNEKGHFVVPKAVREFKSFQRMFARNIREQGWLENGLRPNIPK